MVSGCIGVENAHQYILSIEATNKVWRRSSRVNKVNQVFIPDFPQYYIGDSTTSSLSPWAIWRFAERTVGNGGKRQKSESEFSELRGGSGSKKAEKEN